MNLPSFPVRRALAHCTAVATLLIVFLVFVAGPARASDFAVVDSAGQRHSALLLSARADVEVNGLLVFGTLTQKFLNNGPDFVAGEYVFPLPDGASIDSLVVKVGGRTIEATLKEKDQASAEFEQAKASGQQAALLQQDRPNLFRMAVANIGAGEEIEVVLSYLDTVEQDGDNYSLRLPTTLTPRYNPVARERDDGESALGTDVLNSFSNPAFTAASLGPTGLPNNPIDIRVALKTGFSALPPISASHEITVQQRDDVE
ncbi:MAG: VIT domain-containing protein, partial [Pseudomonadota bacterium]